MSPPPDNLFRGNFTGTLFSRARDSLPLATQLSTLLSSSNQITKQATNDYDTDTRQHETRQTWTNDNGRQESSSSKIKH
eukprot:scaffold1338_cov272-Chaetoceros_neogracile.AAC.22